jgi:uncharacterized membrane protein YgcG
MRKLTQAVNALQQRFPQVSVAVVIAATPVQTPINIYAFWLFNRASLFSAVEKAGENRGFLLLIDPQRGEVAVMIGYGLEPFIGETALIGCVSSAASLMQEGLVADAVMASLACLDQKLTEQCQALPRAFGLLQPEAETRNAASDDDLF